nr:Chain C, Arf-GAP with Rho-GAP domain, ANK repeat and PH domain-containing protein 1 [Mus musculus]5XHZ_D Chain D, Arf-GAP with Rho-GAP domain, ANK repeat and PH domain-containing protein 1 [Mus musculus]
RPVPMKRHIFR